MKGASGYDESMGSESSSLGFYELFGMKSSYLDMQIAARLVQSLAADIETCHRDGETAELTIGNISKEREKELEMLLNQMKIYPWVEKDEDGKTTFSIDNKREVDRLAFFIPLEAITSLVASDVPHTHAAHLGDFGAFESSSDFYEVARTSPAEVAALDEYREILAAAKYDKEKMGQAVRMTAYLVNTVVDRIQLKFGPHKIFAEDDLFRAGLEGLLYGLRNFEKRETSYSIYLVSCIEGSMRRLFRTKKE